MEVDPRDDDDIRDELSQAREMLDRRYDDLASGRVQPIDGEEAFRRLMEKTEQRRCQSA